MTEIRVEAIHIHPVKSCRRIEVDEAAIVATGLAHDRQWQIVDTEGGCVTQRNHPSLATIETALDGDDVILSASGCGSVTLSTRDASSVTVLPLVGRRPVEGVDGDQVNLNGNHPLAGETLHFNIEIMGIRDATEEELSHGHVHDGSHQH